MLRKLLFTYYNNKIYNLNLLNKVVNFYLFKLNQLQPFQKNKNIMDCSEFFERYRLDASSLLLLEAISYSIFPYLSKYLPP